MTPAIDRKYSLTLILSATSLAMNLVLLVYLFGFSQSTSQNSTSQLTTHEVTIIDENGTPQIVMSADSIHGASLRLGSKEAKQLLLLAAEDATKISIEGSTHVPDFEIEAKAKISTHLKLGFENKKTFSLSSLPLKTELTLANNQDNKKIILGSAAGNSGLMITDESNVPRVGLYYNKDNSNLVLFDKRGLQRSAFSLLGAKPQIALFDSLKRPRLSLLLHNNSPSFEYYDEDGKIRYKLMEANSDPVMAFINKDSIPLVTFGIMQNKPILNVDRDKSNPLWRLPE